MEEISENEVSSPSPTRRRPDLLTALMAACTGLFLIASLWMRFGPEPRSQPPRVGSLAPRIELTDLDGKEKFVFTGPTGKLIWIAFCSTNSDRAKEDLKALERIWKRYEGHRSFLLLVAIEADDVDPLDSKVAQVTEEIPTYRATVQTRDRFGLSRELLPVHFVIDGDGRILTSSLEIRGDSVNELEKIVRARLEELDPGGGARFANPRGKFEGNGTDVVAGTAGR